MVTDWNDTLAAVFRQDVNYYVPCYFMAFPPYRVRPMATDTCPVAEFTAADHQTSRKGTELVFELCSC